MFAKQRNRSIQNYDNILLKKLNGRVNCIAKNSETSRTLEAIKRRLN